MELKVTVNIRDYESMIIKSKDYGDAIDCYNEVFNILLALIEEIWVVELETPWKAPENVKLSRTIRIVKIEMV